MPGKKKQSKKTVEEDDTPEPYVYQHPKPAIIGEAALPAWEIIASFSEVATVCELECLCLDVAAALAASRTGTRLMQRYWNAQWNRLIREEAEMPEEKKFLLPAALSRSEGKKNWKALYAEEYPRWVQRTNASVGTRNACAEGLLARFERLQLNEHLTAEQLAARRLSPQEAAAKKLQKERESNGKTGPLHEPHLVKRRPKGEGERQLTEPLNGESYTRVDYQYDNMLGKRKGKTHKGEKKRVLTYTEEPEYD